VQFASLRSVWLSLCKFDADFLSRVAVMSGQKAQAPTPQAPIRNRKTRKVANAKVYNRYTNRI